MSTSVPFTMGNRGERDFSGRCVLQAGFKLLKCSADIVTLVLDFTSLKILC